MIQGKSAINNEQIFIKQKPKISQNYFLNTERILCSKNIH